MPVAMPPSARPNPSIPLVGRTPGNEVKKDGGPSSRLLSPLSARRGASCLSLPDGFGSPGASPALRLDLSRRARGAAKSGWSMGRWRIAAALIAALSMSLTLLFCPLQFET